MNNLSFLHDNAAHKFDSKSYLVALTYFLHLLVIIIFFTMATLDLIRGFNAITADNLKDINSTLTFYDR